MSNFIVTETDGNGQQSTPLFDEPNGQAAPTNRIIEAALNPFDPASLRLDQDFASTLGVRKVLTTVPCRKPNRHEFVRVRPAEEWRLETGIFEDKTNREVYLVRRDLWPELAGEVYPVCLFLTVNRQSDVFFWPVKLPGADGKSNVWNDSALAAAGWQSNNGFVWPPTWAPGSTTFTKPPASYPSRCGLS